MIRYLYLPQQESKVKVEIVWKCQDDQNLDLKDSNFVLIMKIGI